MDLVLLAVAAVLVNNFVLTQFLGLCPFLGVSRKIETAAGMAAATAFVLTLASVLSYLAFTYILVPLDAEYLRTPTFILIIAVAVQLTEMAVRFTSPLLQQVLGLYLPLITTNCAVLGVALLNLREGHDLVASTVYGAGAAAGFGLVLIVFAALRERLELSDVPKPFRGAPIALVSAGILAMGFMGFAGLAHAGSDEGGRPSLRPLPAGLQQARDEADDALTPRRGYTGTLEVIAKAGARLGRLPRP